MRQEDSLIVWPLRSSASTHQRTLPVFFHWEFPAKELFASPRPLHHGQRGFALKPVGQETVKLLCLKPGAELVLVEPIHVFTVTVGELGQQQTFRVRSVDVAPALTERVLN